MKLIVLLLLIILILLVLIYVYNYKLELFDNQYQNRYDRSNERIINKTEYNTQINELDTNYTSLITEISVLNSKDKSNFNQILNDKLKTNIISDRKYNINNNIQLDNISNLFKSINNNIEILYNFSLNNDKTKQLSL